MKNGHGVGDFPGKCATRRSFSDGRNVQEQTARRHIEKDPIYSTEKRDERVALAFDRTLGRVSDLRWRLSIRFFSSRMVELVNSRYYSR